MLAALASLPLAVWRRSPLGVFALTTAASAVLFGIGSAPGPPFGPTIALYLLAASRDDAHPWTRRTTAVVVGLFVVHVGAAGAGQSEVPAAPLLFGVLVWTIAWFAGDRTRMRRERLAAAEDSHRARAAARDGRGARADRPRPARLGRPRDQRDPRPGRRRAAAAGARPAAQRAAALETIEEVARDTIGEIDAAGADAARRPGAGRPACRRRRPRLARHARRALPRGRARRRGRDDGHARDRSARPPIGAAYRIVQESLTNASRHGTGSARVELAFGDGVLS